MFSFLKRDTSAHRRLDELEKNMKQLELQWEGFYGKSRALISNMVRRMNRDADRAMEEPNDNPVAPSLPSSATQRQQQINAQILARRNRLEAKQ